MEDDLYYSGKFFLIINTNYLLTFSELNSYWIIEYKEKNIIYGYNHLYGSTLIFNKKDIKILGDVNDFWRSGEKYIATTRYKSLVLYENMTIDIILKNNYGSPVSFTFINGSVTINQSSLLGIYTLMYSSNTWSVL